MSAHIAQDLDGRLRELMARAHVPGLSAVVVEEGQLTWSGAFGRSLEELMQTDVLAPLGMLHSTFAWAPSEDPAVAAAHDKSSV